MRFKLLHNNHKNNIAKSSSNVLRYLFKNLKTMVYQAFAFLSKGKNKRLTAQDVSMTQLEEPSLF